MSFQDRVQILDKNGNYISQFGETGTGQLQFARVKGISIAEDRIIVSDSENNRIQALNLDDKTFVQYLGIGDMLNPTGVHFDGTRLYVVDSDNNRIQIFDYVVEPDIPVDPVDPVEEFNKAFKAAFKKSLPTGDAFQPEPNLDADKYHQATAKVFAQALDDFISVENLTIPKIPVDDDFTLDDLARLENAYGLLINKSIPVENRLAALEQKMKGASGYQGRQSAAWLQDQLFNAGFEVYVLENKFSDGAGGYETKVPRWKDVNIVMQDDEYMGQETPFEDRAVMGRNVSTIAQEPKIVNSIYPEEDSVFDMGNLQDDTNPLLKSTFFLTGGTGGAVGVRGIPDYEADATIPSNRELEFRILVLANKPAHTAALQHIKLS